MGSDSCYVSDLVHFVHYTYMSMCTDHKCLSYTDFGEVNDLNSHTYITRHRRDKAKSAYDGNSIRPTHHVTLINICMGMHGLNRTWVNWVIPKS